MSPSRILCHPPERKTHLGDEESDGNCLFPAKRRSKTMAVAVANTPILSRLDRLDNMLRRLEEIRCCSRSTKSSCASSTLSSGTLNSDGPPSSVDFSPKSLEKHCRPINLVVMETGVKGTLIERLEHVEYRVLKLEEEVEGEKIREELEQKMSEKKKGLKQFVKQIVKRKHKDKKLV
ncbi:uncharacterized protein LOC123213573 isoform X2 [Mangifera indica]|uniref:uncharacterized protein LOC123213573 isoform X2 n=1 Tax=Mangifera indica TaxID=29780 RepID=UPI001CFBFFAF|nr:uncharacterized protein LOC123213573 isoform X2 [Mangifera indica]